MNLHLQGHTATIIGAARGIGLAIAREFAHEKANLALFDREPAVEAVARQLAAEFGVRTCACVGDVTNYDSVQKATARIQRELGRLDHLVYAVAIGSGKFGFPFWNLQPSDWPRVMEINVQGAVHVLHAFAPHYVQAKSGSILLIASISGQIGSQTDPPYSASKAALINFMQCAAKDLAPYNVRVNALCPGMVKTELNKAVWEAWNRQQPAPNQQTYEEWAEEKIRRVVPLGRWQQPEDMAAMTVFLASDRAANITGQCLNVDGGFVMHW
jgi:NAD(P)-dependent dehydrogenase (short-subunit alcohol dehydrogenase family)